MSKLREEDIHALVDGEIEESQRAEVEAQLVGLPEEAERVRVYRQFNAGLKALYDPVLDEPVPARLLALRARRGVWLARYAAAAVLIAFGVALGWFARSLAPIAPSPAPTLARQAAVAHAVYAPEVRHPVEVGAAEEDHLVRWLSKRLGTELKCPKLGHLGFDLVGGRLLAGPNGPVAHFMFQDARGARLTLYVSAQRGESRQTAFRFSQEDRISVFYWIDGRFGYALSGEMGREQLLKIANHVYAQLNP